MTRADLGRWTCLTGLGLPALGLLLIASLALGPAVGCSGQRAAVCDGDCSCDRDLCTCATSRSCQLSGGGAGGTPPSNLMFDCASGNVCEVDCGENCTTRCGERTSCSGTCEAACSLDCAGQSMCNLVTGAEATADCAGGSSCNLATGRSAVVTCTGGSDCLLELGPDSFAECGGSATCRVSCPEGRCEVDCDGSSTCFCEGPGCLLRCPEEVQECDGLLVCAGDACPEPPPVTSAREA